MYNRLYGYLQDNKLLYNKQFGFRKNHATDHAIIELVDQITNSFKKLISLLLVSSLTYQRHSTLLIMILC